MIALRRFERAVKRAMDIVIVLASMPIALPLIVTFGLAIACETPGGPFFRQPRVGLRGRTFLVWKLRTMVANAQTLGAGLYAERNDPRFTTIGKLARRLSVDELPQIINVLLGQMSIVGPRPMLSEIVAEYRQEYDEILTVKPGITGLAQVSGRNTLSRSERLRLDRIYARDWSIAFDLKILAKTIGVVISGEGQRNDQGRADVER